MTTQLIAPPYPTSAHHSVRHCGSTTLRNANSDSESPLTVSQYTNTMVLQQRTCGAPTITWRTT